jgi:hypothetical protein
MADPGIVQKDEIAVIRPMCLRITHKRDARVALLPDCLRRRGARN